MTLVNPIPYAYASWEAYAKRYSRERLRDDVTQTTGGLHAYWLACAAEARKNGATSSACSCLSMAAAQRLAEIYPPYGIVRAEWRSVVYDDCDNY